MTQSYRTWYRRRITGKPEFELQETGPAVLIQAGNKTSHVNFFLLYFYELLICPRDVEAGARTALDSISMMRLPPRPVLGWKYASHGLGFFIFIILVSFMGECGNTSETGKEVDHVLISTDTSDNIGSLEILQVMDPNGPY